MTLLQGTRGQVEDQHGMCAGTVACLLIPHAAMSPHLLQALSHGTAASLSSEQNSLLQLAMAHGPTS